MKDSPLAQNLLTAVILTGIVASAAAIGSQLSGGMQRVIVDALIKVTLVVGTYVFVGNSGILSFGHVGFLAIGAYTSAWLTIPPSIKLSIMPGLPAVVMNAQWSPVTATVAGGLASAIMALLVGFPLTRMAGIAASIGTFAMLIIIYAVSSNWTSVTGGQGSLYGLPAFTGLFVASVVAGVTIFGAAIYQASGAGFRLRGSREDPVAAKACGIRRPARKACCFCPERLFCWFGRFDLRKFSSGRRRQRVPLEADLYQRRNARDRRHEIPDRRRRGHDIRDRSLGTVAADRTWLHIRGGRDCRTSRIAGDRPCDRDAAGSRVSAPRAVERSRGRRPNIEFTKLGNPERSEENMKLFGVDVGGTFTDVMYSDTVSKQLFVHKVPTTPEDPSIGVMTGILELCQRNRIHEAEIDYVFHGTTIATNAVLEYRGAEAGMITTRGFRDIIHIGRHQRPQHYSIMQEIPWQNRPLVKRRHRKVVTERLLPPNGDVLIPLAEGEVREAARELKKSGVKSIAICFLFSYLNPAHEERARAIVQEEYPEAFVTTSNSIVSQFREFERFTTTAMNSYIGPPVRNYIRQLDDALRNAGMKAELRIMRSNGGVATPTTISEFPVLTLLSGPAAGVLGGALSGGLSGRKNLITFDVGGTSADIGVTNEGRFSEASARDTKIAGYPVLVPMIDIHTIGAGGGSVAYVDQGGRFHVGPRSAGSKPGPAAYNRGGQEPTVTDANVVLGRLDKDNFLGGEMNLDVDAAQRVVQSIANRLGLPVDDAAAGIVTVLNSNMANAIRSRTVQKGIDPRDFALMAFGGAGPLHGAEVADMLGISEVIVPAYPGITSALGLLASELKYDSIRTQFHVSGNIDLKRMNADLVQMEDDIIRQFAADRVSAGDVKINRYADARYVGQGYELRIDLALGTLGEEEIDSALEQFHIIHYAEYGHSFPQNHIEIVNIRVTGTAASQTLEWPKGHGGGSLEKALIKLDTTKFRVDGELRSFDTSFYRRGDLPIGQSIAGPAILLQLDTTTVVPPTWTFIADVHGNLILSAGVSI